MLTEVDLSPDRNPPSARVFGFVCEEERATPSERGEGESWSGYSCPGAELQRRGKYCKNTTSPLLLLLLLPQYCLTTSAESPAEVVRGGRAEMEARLVQSVFTASSSLIFFQFTIEAKV